MLHPTVRMIGLMVFALLLPALQPGFLAGIGLVLLVMLLRLQGLDTFFLLFRRARWLLVSILFIYAFATPGELLPQLPETFSPTYEGIHAGMLQALRLCMMLAALAVLLSSTSQRAIMAGIFVLLVPLRPLGISPERFAARLWLTLHYVEIMPTDTFRNLHQNGWRLDAMVIAGEHPDTLNVEVPRFTILDACVLSLILLVTWVVV